MIEDLPEWALENILEEQYEEEEFAHEAIRKGEHHLGGLHAMPTESWRPEFHSRDDPEYEHKYQEEELHFEEPIIEQVVEEKKPESHKLAPKKPKEDDPRINIPKAPATESHDHMIVQKDPTPTEDDHEPYGLAYEADHKHHMNRNRTSRSLEAKLPDDKPQSVTRKPCSTYGEKNRCEGMSCQSDTQCASTCCGQMSSDGTMTCHALIENAFCPRAVAPRIDYTVFDEDMYDDLPYRNDLLATKPLSNSNEMPTYRGQDGCKVHGSVD